MQSVGRHRALLAAVCGLLVAVVCVISGTLQRSRTQATALFIAKENDRRADFNSEIPMETPGWQYDNYANFNPPVDAEPVMTKAGALNKKYGFSTWQGPTNSYSPPIQGGRYGTSNELDGTDMSAVFKASRMAMLKSARGAKLQQLRIAKENDRRADFNSEIPMETPGWQYDNYANFNPPVDAEPVMTKAGALNKKYGFSTWQGPTNSYSPPIQGGRYGTSNELDGTDMSAVFKTPSTPMLRMQPFAFARPQMKGALYYTGSSTPGRGYYADLVTNPRETPMAYLEKEAAAKAAAQEEADAASSLEEADTESAARRPRVQLMGRYAPTSRVFSVFGR